MVTHFEADTMIKDRFGPYAEAIDDGKPGPYRCYVGACPFYGKGTTWEEAFANLHSTRLDVRRREKVPRSGHKCAFCRRPRKAVAKSTKR